MSEQIKIFDFIVDFKQALAANKEFVEKQTELKVGIVAIREENKKLNAELRKLNKERLAGDESAIERSKAVGAQLAQNEKALKELGAQVKTTNKEFEKAKFAEGSIKGLRAELSLLTKEYDELGEVAREGLGGQRLLSNIQGITDRLKDLEGQTGRNQRNVGNYKDAFKDLQIESDRALSGILGGLQDANPAFGSAISGGEQFGDVLTVISKNPFVGLLSAGAAILVTLGNAFFKSEKGARVLAKGAAFLEGVMSTLVSVSTDVVEFFGLFNEETEQANENTGLFSGIVEDLTNRFVGLLSLIEQGGKAIGQFLTGNFDEAEKSATAAGLAISQVTSGFDLNAQSTLVNKFKEATTEIERNTSAFINLEKAQFAARQEARQLEISIAELTTQQEIQGAIADDTTKSLDAQNEARVKELDFAVQASAQRVKLASTELALLQSEIALRRSNNEDVQGLLDQETQAIVGVRDAQRELTLETLNNERERNQIRQDALELQLDIVRDGFENLLSVNLGIINDEEQTLEKRREIFETLNKESDKSFKEQIRLIQLNTDAVIDGNDLVNESDSIALQEKINNLQLSELITKQLFDAIRDRRGAVQDLTDAQVTLNQATENQRVIDIQIQQSQDLTTLFNDATKTEQEIAEAAKVIQENAQRETLQATIASTTATKAERLKAEEELAELEFQIRNDARDKELQAAIDAIEIKKNAEIAAVLNTVEDEEARQTQIAAIEARATQNILSERLRLEELTEVERSNLQLQGIQQRESAELASEQRLASKKKEIQQTASQTAQQLIAAVGQFQAAQTQRQLNILTRAQEAELEAAGNNADERERIEQRFAAEREAIEREGFERRKRLSRAEAVIGGALAIVKAFSELGPIAGAITSVGIGITTAAQLATINAQEFKQGGILKGVKHGENGHKGIAMIDKKSGSLMAYAERDEAVMTSASTNAGRNLGLTSTLNQIFGGSKLGSGGTPPPEPLHNALKDWISGKSTGTTATFRQPRKVEYGRIKRVQSGQSEIDYKLLASEIVNASSKMPAPELNITALNKFLANSEKEISFKHG